MNIAPLLHAPLAIQIHLLTVVPAFAIGTCQIVSPCNGFCSVDGRMISCHGRELLLPGNRRE